MLHDIMEFVLPVMFASGEAMIWVLIGITLLIIGRGKLLPSEKTLFIERPGQYSMRLAPGLNLAQPFIEAVAKQLGMDGAPRREGMLLVCEVQDKSIVVNKQSRYLLSVAWRNGLLHFEATADMTMAATIAVEDDWPELSAALLSVAQAWNVRLQLFSSPILSVPEPCAPA